MPDIVIMRHGHAMPSDTDPDRGLTETGIADSIYVADQLAAAGIRVERILHSGKTRARQTAEILTDRVGRSAAIEVRKGLDPNDEIDAIAQELSSIEEDIAVVGHLPHLELLLTRLVGKEYALKLPPAAAVHLKREGIAWSFHGRYKPHR
ncbi:MAG: phosphohistidine phosphatase SixA [Candidatus Eisenbacteria bacterium]|nr:phosphohistidine phosphatase SixA [Candidatus Eisenbacteria bacterium]